MGASWGRAVALTAAVVTIAGCGAGAPADPARPFAGQTLVVTSYGGGWEEHMRAEVLPGFEARTGATVQLGLGVSSEFATQLRIAGRESPPYDVVVSNETYMARLRGEDFFAPLDEGQVPNLALVQPAARAADPTGTSVLSLVNPLGIAYRSDQVTTPPASFAELAAQAHDRPTGIFNISATPAAMLTLTLAGAKTGDPTDWRAGFAEVRGMCPVRQAGTVENMTTLLTDGTVAVAVHDLGAVARMKAAGVPVGWVLPSEGAFGYDQNISVTSGSDQRDLAMAFVDYWLGTEVQQGWTDNYLYFPMNRDAVPAAALTALLPSGTDVYDSLLTFDWKAFNAGPADDLADAWNREMSNC